MKELTDILLNATISLPFYEVALMLVVITLCFLFHSFRFGLLVAFLFVFRLGWLFFSEHFGINQIGYIVAYSAFGIVVFVFACYELFFGES
jgi:Na+/citrate or Na+/malate symporter